MPNTIKTLKAIKPTHEVGAFYNLDLSIQNLKHYLTGQGPQEIEPNIKNTPEGRLVIALNVLLDRKYSTAEAFFQDIRLTPYYYDLLWLGQKKVSNTMIEFITRNFGINPYFVHGLNDDIILVEDG